jgi:hypothetical protein
VLLPRVECERRIKRVVSHAVDNTKSTQSSVLHPSDDATLPS